MVASLGLLYTTLSRGDDSIMIPNNIVLAAAVVPLREPSSVDLRARLRPDVMPSTVQELLEAAIATPVRAAPHIGLELSGVEIALMKRIKAAFDPLGILNPGKIFPDG